MILERIKNKIKGLLATHVPYNTQYKPSGIKTISASSGIKYLEIHPPYTSTLTLSQAFIKDCSPHLKPTLNVDFPPDFIVAVKGGRLFSSDSNNIAVMAADNHLIEEVSIQWGDDNMLEARENAVFKRKGFPPPTRFKGTVFSLLSNGDPKYYYYHFVFDLLPKLHLLKQSGYAADYYLVPNWVHKYQREYFDHFGITHDKIITEESNPHIAADVIVVCPMIRKKNHHPKWACAFLYDSFIRTYKAQGRNKLIYIARGDAARYRKVINEGELIEGLKEIGVETFFLSLLTVEEQASLLHSAKLVIGVHGGGLTNLVYAGSGTTVLEIFPDNYIRHRFFDLSQKRELEYHYMTCPHHEIHPNGQILSLTADINAIKDKVRSLLSALADQ